MPMSVSRGPLRDSLSDHCGRNPGTIKVVNGVSSRVLVRIVIGGGVVIETRRHVIVNGFTIREIVGLLDLPACTGSCTGDKKTPLPLVGFPTCSMTPALSASTILLEESVNSPVP